MNIEEFKKCKIRLGKPPLLDDTQINCPHCNGKKEFETIIKGRFVKCAICHGEGFIYKYQATPNLIKSLRHHKEELK